VLGLLLGIGVQVGGQGAVGGGIVGDAAAGALDRTGLEAIGAGGAAQEQLGGGGDDGGAVALDEGAVGRGGAGGDGGVEGEGVAGREDRRDQAAGEVDLVDVAGGDVVADAIDGAGVGGVVEVGGEGAEARGMGCRGGGVKGWRGEGAGKE
jgi:hypothetical protein